MLRVVRLSEVIGFTGREVNRWEDGEASGGIDGTARSSSGRSWPNALRLEYTLLQWSLPTACIRT
jgi:hypothetical protein